MAEARKAERGLSVRSGEEGPADGDGGGGDHSGWWSERLEECQCMVGRKLGGERPKPLDLGPGEVVSRARWEESGQGGHCS